MTLEAIQACNSGPIDSYKGYGLVIVQLIGALVGASITAYLLTGFITLFMRGRLNGINGSEEDLNKAGNAMWFRASIVALVVLAASGLVRLLRARLSHTD